MEKLRYVKLSNLPPRLPVLQAIVWWMSLDRLNAPGWLCGVVGTIYGVLFIAAAFAIYKGHPVDLFAPGRLNK